MKKTINNLEIKIKDWGLDIGDFIRVHPSGKPFNPKSCSKFRWNPGLILIGIFAYFLLPTISSAQFNLLWTQTVNPSATGTDESYAITADASGIYVAGIEFISGSDYQWRIEKRDLTTGSLISAFGTGGVVTRNPSFGSDDVWAITADASGIYVVGFAQVGAVDYQWYMEKRNLTTGAVIWTQTSDPSAGFDVASAITADASAIYVAGFEWPPATFDPRWRIEKRDLTTGALIAAFGTGGVITSDPSAGYDVAYSITADASAIYVAGTDDAGSFDNEWRIEKRNKTTGLLVTAFDGDGVVTINPTIGGADAAQAIIADASGIYVAGSDESSGAGNTQWRIEKRNKTNGALIAAFGTGGVVTSNPSASSDVAYSITADASGIYVAGSDESPGTGNTQWRIEKRNLITGSLTCTVTSNPSVLSDVAYGTAVDASGIYATGWDNYGAGNLQWRIEKYDLCGGTTLAASVVSQNLLCNGQCMGTGTITPTGGTSPYAYLWNTVPVQTTPVATGLCAGTYTVTVTDGVGATVTATIAITQPSVVTSSVTFTSANCGNNNGTATANAGGGTPGYTYSWLPFGGTNATATGLATGNYTATITDANGCTATQSVTIIASGSIIATATSSAICAGQSATLTASGGSSYSWNSGQTTAAINITPTVTTTYSVIVSNGNCSDTATATVTVTPGITTVQSAILCYGSTYTLPSGTVVSTEGAYIDTLTSIVGCDSIITTTLTVNPNPTVGVFSNTTITQGQSVTLTSSGGGTYNWSNGSNGSSIMVTPVVTTIYCVTVTDANNCSDTACVTVTIEPIDCSNAGEIYLPNAFSPNNDGENDKLQIYYGDIRCIKTFKLVTYNRWGEKVFETTNPAAQWDGYYKEKAERTAVFVYYMNAMLISGEEIIRKGNVSLIK